MKIAPPAGSRISTMTSELGEPVILVPVTEDAARYFIGIFMLVWLCGWIIGETTFVSKVLSGEALAWFGKANGEVSTIAIATFWFFGWTLGGMFAAYMAYGSLRPQVPESLRLMRSGVGFDSGLRRPRFERNNKGLWGSLPSLFPKRIRCQINLRQLQSLRLRETDTGSRLTVDIDSRRIDIAIDATEVEREWLARVLTDRYALTQVLVGERAPAAVE